MVLPFLKLGSLLLKTITKPLSSRLKFEAQRRPKFQAMCGWVGQWSHYVFTRINVFASGYKFIGVKPLPPNDAVDVGISYLSEGIVMGSAASIVIVEFDRGETKNKLKAEKQAAKEAAEKAELEARFRSIDERIQDVEKALPPVGQKLVASLRADRTAAAAAQAAAAKLAATEATEAAAAAAARAPAASVMATILQMQWPGFHSVVAAPVPVPAAVDVPILRKR